MEIIDFNEKVDWQDKINEILKNILYKINISINKSALIFDKYSFFSYFYNYMKLNLVNISLSNITTHNITTPMHLSG